MTVQDILNQIEIQSEYVIVIYDYEKEERLKLEECPFTKSIEIRYMYVEDDTIFFELDEHHLYSDEGTKNGIEFLNPKKI